MCRDPEQKPYLDVLKQLPANVTVTGVGLEVADFSPAALKAADICLFCAGHNPVLLRKLWPHLKSLKWLHSFYAGVNHLLFPELVESNVVMTNARVSAGEIVLHLADPMSAERLQPFSCGVLSVGHAVLRQGRESTASIAQGACCAAHRAAAAGAHCAYCLLPWLQQAEKWQPLVVEELRGQTLGVIGLGDIGRRCAQLARGVGMRVIGLRRSAAASGAAAAKDPDVEELFGPAQLNELMARSDFVVVATPLTDGGWLSGLNAWLSCMGASAQFTVCRDARPGGREGHRREWFQSSCRARSPV